MRKSLFVALCALLLMASLALRPERVQAQFAFALGSSQWFSSQWMDFNGNKYSYQGWTVDPRADFLVGPFMISGAYCMGRVSLLDKDREVFQRHFIHPEGWLDTVSSGNSLRNVDVSLFYYPYHRRRFKCAVGVKYTYFLLPFGDPTGWFPLDFPSVPQKTSVWSPVLRLEFFFTHHTGIYLEGAIPLTKAPYLVNASLGIKRVIF